MTSLGSLLSFLVLFVVANIGIDGSENRAALVVTIAGSHKLVDYFEWSCRSIEASSSLFDMLIFHESNERLNKIKCANNVILIDVGVNGFSKMIVDAIMEGTMTSNDTRADVVSLLERVLVHIPRYLVEVKPITGKIFSHWLAKYSHWSYTDPDIIWGDLSRWLDEDDVSQYQIITFSKLLDAGRLFLRGQFALHQNIDKINNIWKTLPHFQPSAFTSRIASASHALSLPNPEHSNRIFSKNFVSAEGAYSKAVFSLKGVKVKIVGRGFDDFSRSPVVRLANGTLFRCDVVESWTPPDPLQVVKGDLGDCLRTLEHALSPHEETAIILKPNATILSNETLLLELELDRGNHTSSSMSLPPSGTLGMPRMELVLGTSARDPVACRMQWLPTEYRLCSLPPSKSLSHYSLLHGFMFNLVVNDDGWYSLVDEVYGAGQHRRGITAVLSDVIAKRILGKPVEKRLEHDLILARANEVVLQNGQWYFNDETESQRASTVAAFFHFRHWDDFAASGYTIQWEAYLSQGSNNFLDGCMMLSLLQDEDSKDTKLIAYQSCKYILNRNENSRTTAKLEDKREDKRRGREGVPHRLASLKHPRGREREDGRRKDRMDVERERKKRQRKSGRRNVH